MLVKKSILVLVVFGLIMGCSQNQVKAGSTKTEGAKADDKVFDMPYLMRDLDNGLRVIVVPTDYPEVVSLQIPIQSGSRNEIEEGKSGFAHFFEHMMFHGTPTYSTEQYGDVLKKCWS